MELYLQIWKYREEVLGSSVSKPLVGVWAHSQRQSDHESIHNYRKNHISQSTNNWYISLKCSAPILAYSFKQIIHDNLEHANTRHLRAAENRVRHTAPLGHDCRHFRRYLHNLQRGAMQVLSSKTRKISYHRTKKRWTPGRAVYAFQG